MGEVLLFLFACAGLAHIIVDSTIMAPIRSFLEKSSKIIGELVSCYLCTGFWCGIFLGMLMNIHMEDFHFCLSRIIIQGCAGAFASMLGAALVNYLDIQSFADKS